MEKETDGQGVDCEFNISKERGQGREVAREEVGRLYHEG